MSKIRLLEEKRGEKKELTVSILRDWLVRAMSGDIAGVIIMGEQRDGGYMRSSDGNLSRSTSVYLASLVIAEATNETLGSEGAVDVDFSSSRIDALRDLLTRAGVDVDAEEVSKWSDDQIKTAERWATKVLSKDDEDPPPHRPNFLFSSAKTRQT